MAKRQGKLVLGLAVCLLLAGAAAGAAEEVKVAVLPFTVNAGEDLGYLRLEIPGQIVKRLGEEGAAASVAQGDLIQGRDPAQVPENELRDMAAAQGLDYLVWGSFSKIGTRFSLDAKVLPVSVASPVDVFFREGGGIQSLTPEISGLSEGILAKIMGKKTVREIVISGNRRIEKDAILGQVKTKAGDVFSAPAISRDIKSIFGMGYFDDVTAEAEEVAGGRKITFRLVEKPTVGEITVTGNDAIGTEDIMEAVEITRGSILNQLKLEESVRRIEDLYKEKNYYGVLVKSKVTEKDQNIADLAFTIEEGKKQHIREIKFEGNSDFPAKKLKGIIKTSEKGFLSWITSSGSLNREDLEQDVARLGAFYQNNGYIDAKVAEPDVEYKEDAIHITFKIMEGPRYRVGKVDVAGDLVYPKGDILSKLKIGKEDHFNREVVRTDLLYLSDMYTDLGYAHAEVVPRIDKDEKTLVVNPTYTITKGPLVYFERIIIEGNTKTRDKVIRRQLPVEEQGLFSGHGIKRGVANLQRLDFFEDVKTENEDGSVPDKMALRLNVTEKPTGAFTFGGGYSNIDNAFAVGSISQRNLFGRGQSLDLKAQAGGSTTRYSLGFTEPYLMDSKLLLGLDAYNWNKDYDSYEKHSVGGRIRFAYPLAFLMDYTKLHISYLYEIVDINNVQSYAANAVKDLEGENTTSKAAAAVVYDSRNRAFNPSSGSMHSVNFENAGNPFGGDIAFSKVTAESGWYFPLFRGTVFHARGEGGWVRENSGGVLPIYERFYLGGIGSLRGFDWHDLSPVDKNGAEIGGNKYLLANFEFIFPLIKQAGLMGVGFFDTGASWNNGEDARLDEFRESAGGGLRWFSPVGPIRLEYGFVLDKEPWETNEGKWEFTMGQTF
jgi:outer membrane protein insertion porin family